MNYRDIMLAFWQQGSNNCVSIALIKAAIETFGIDQVFTLNKEGSNYHVVLKNGMEVNFSEAELATSKTVANFQKSKDQDSDRSHVYHEVLEYAQLCYAAMVATFAKIEGNALSFEEALYILNNGINSRIAASYLGLEDFVHRSFLQSSSQSGMYAWWRKHTVYMSHGNYDYYGFIRSNTWKYPNRFRLEKEEKKALPFVSADKFTDLNYINISRFGTFQETGEHHTLPSQVDAILAHVRATNKKRLLIYFHGGLVSESQGYTGSESFFEKYSGDDNTHIVSIGWETGLKESLPETFKRILRDSLLGKIIEKVGYYFKKKLNIPEKLFEERLVQDPLYHYAMLFGNIDPAESFDELIWKQYPGFMEDTIDESSIEEEMKEMMENEELSTEELVRLGVEPTDSGFLPNPRVLWFAAKIAYRCFDRYRRKRDHGLWPTIVEESVREIKLDWLGSGIWTTMKEQAYSMWLSNDGISGMNRFVGTYLMEKIIHHFPDNDLEVNVVGHSAGSIVLCEWIKAINKRYKPSGFKLNSVVFLAPAVSCKLFHESVLAYPETWNRFRMFTMSDDYEIDDELVPLLYPRSLLYLISGILEGEGAKNADAYILGLHRHIRLRAPYQDTILKEINAFLDVANPLSDRLVLSISDGGDGRMADANSHKGFAFFEGIARSLKYYLS